MNPFAPASLPNPKPPRVDLTPLKPVLGRPSRTIENGVIQSLSVSGIAKFNPDEEGCPLRWHFREVKGYQEPKRVFTEVGDQLHDQMDHYLPTGEDILGKVARTGKHLLPAPGPRLKCEWGLNRKPHPPKKNGKKVSFFPPGESRLKAGKIPLIGFIDVEEPSFEHVMPDGVSVYEPDVIECLDHKTCSSFDFVKTEEGLFQATQMNGYGKYLGDLPEYENVRAIRLSQVYYPTKGPGPAKKVTTLVPIEKFAQRWHMVVGPLSEQMCSVAAERNEKRVPGNLNACGAFGGCPHKRYCHVYQSTTPTERLKLSLQKQKSTPKPEVESMTNLMNKVRGLPGGAAVPPLGGTPANGAAAASNTPWIPQTPGAPALPSAPPAQLTAKDCVNGRAYKFSTGAVGMFLNPAQQNGQTVYSFLQVTNGVAGGEPFPVGPTEPVVDVTPAPAVVQTPAGPPAPPAPPAGPPAPPAIGARSRVPVIDTSTPTPPPAPPRTAAPAGGPPLPPTVGKRGAAKKAESSGGSTEDISAAIAAAKDIFKAQFGVDGSPEQVLPIWQALLR